MLLAVRLLLALVFLVEGAEKFSGSRVWIRIFDQIGWGQWFRYLTGVVEIAGAVLLLIPATALFGAGLLICTMIGAFLVHAFVTGFGRPTVAVAVLLVLLIATGLFSAQARATPYK